MEGRGKGLRGAAAAPAPASESPPLCPPLQRCGQRGALGRFWRGVRGITAREGEHDGRENLSETVFFCCCFFFLLLFLCGNPIYLFLVCTYTCIYLCLRGIYTHIFSSYENIAYRLLFPDVLFSVSFRHVCISAGRGTGTAVMLLSMCLNSSMEQLVCL